MAAARVPRWQCSQIQRSHVSVFSDCIGSFFNNLTYGCCFSCRRWLIHRPAADFRNDASTQMTWAEPSAQLTVDSYIIFNRTSSIPPVSQSDSRVPHAGHSPPPTHREQFLHGAASITNEKLTKLIKSCNRWQDAAELFYVYSDSFNHINVSALACHLPRLLPRSRLKLAQADIAELDNLLGDLQLVAEQELVSCRPRELANIAYGFAKLGCHSKRLMQLILARADLGQFKQQELANLAWACATLQHQPPDSWLQELVQESGRRMASLNMQESCNIAWALVKLQAPVPRVWVDRFCGHLQQHMGSCCGQDISNALWSLAAMQQRPPDSMLQAALQRLQALLVHEQQQRQKGHQSEHQHRQQLHRHEQVNAQQLSNVLWALAHWQQQQQQQQQDALQLPVQLHHLICTQLLELLHLHGAAASSPPNSSSNAANAIICLVALTKLQQPPKPAVQRALLPLLEQHLTRLSSQDCSNLLWVLAKLELQPPVAWMQQLLAAAAPQLQAAKAQELSNMLWALSELQFRPSYPWLLQLLAAAEQRLCSFSSQNLSNLLLGLAKLRRAPPPGWAVLVLRNFVDGLEDRIVRPQELANVLWALPLVGLRQALAQESSRAATAGAAAVAAAGGLQLAVAATADDGSCGGDVHTLVLRLAEACKQRVGEFSPCELAQVVVGVTRMRVHPGAAWAAEFGAAWSLQKRGASQQERQRVLQALDSLAALQGCDVLGEDDSCLVVVPCGLADQWLLLRRQELL